MSGKAVLNVLLRATLLVCFSIGNAGADLFDDLEVHGFATQGYVKTSANSFFGDSESGSFDFRELGVNASFEPTPYLRLSGQLLSRKAGDMSDGSVHVDFALADFSLISTPMFKFDVIFGRVKNPIGFYNDARDVAFTRPSIFLPQTVYFQSVRSLALSADGIAVRTGFFPTWGNFELQVGVGDPIVDENVEYAYLGDSFSGDFEETGSSWIGRLLYSSPNEKWRFSVSGAFVTLDFSPRGGDLLPPGVVDIPYVVFSGQYLSEKWALTVEYVNEAVEYHDFYGSPLSGLTPVLEGYYGQFNWMPNPGLELFVRYEEGFYDTADRSGRKFSALTGLPAFSRFHKAHAVGVRWDIAPDIEVRAEFQKTDGTLTLSNKENESPFAAKRGWNMWSLLASYRF